MKSIEPLDSTFGVRERSTRQLRAGLAVRADLERLERRLLLDASGASYRIAQTVAPAQVQATAGFTYATSPTWRMSDSLEAGGAQTTNSSDASAGPVLVETTNLHDQLETAQPIPDVPVARLSGALSATDHLDLYRIPTDPNTLSLQVTVTATLPSYTLPGRIWLLDEAGRIIGDWAIPPGTHSITVTLRSVAPPGDRSLVFGISHGDASNSDPSAPPQHYEVTVTRENGPAGLPNPVPGPIVPLPPGGLAARTATSVTEPGLATTVAPGSVGIDVSLVPTGPLPTRSAGPSGGRFADGDPVPPIDRFDAALVDLKLIELLPPGPAQAAAQVDRAPVDQARAQLSELPSLVALPAAGGFPLLAANLSSELQLAAPSVAILPLLQSEGAGCNPGEPAAGSPRTPLAPEDADPADERGRVASTQRGPILVGLNVAAALAFGLLLPDLVAALQSVTPRRDLPEILRDRSGRRAEGFDAI